MQLSDMMMRILGKHEDNLSNIIMYLYRYYIQLKESCGLEKELGKLGNVDEIIESYIKDFFDEEIYNNLLETDFVGLKPEEIKDCIINFDKYTANFGLRSLMRLGALNTPNSIVDLSLPMVNYKKNLKVLNLCSGTGANLVSLIKNGFNDITGVTVNNSNAFISSVRIILMKEDKTELNINIINNDVFDYSLNNENDKYDLVLMNPPWNLKSNNLMMKWQEENYRGINFSDNSNWYFLALALKHLRSNGRAVVLSPPSVEYVHADKEIRNYFIKNGYIEKIIQLPNKFFTNTSVAPLMFVLSHDNKKINFIDASEEFSESGRVSVLSPENIKSIVNRVKKEEFNININEVLSEERLMPKFYSITSFNEYVELGKISTIIRGKNYSRKDLDELISDTVTKNELLRTSHLDNGLIIDRDYLTSFPEHAVALEDLDILLTRVGSNKNVAIYIDNNGTSSIADQTILTIRVNKKKYNPFYILAFLMSELGKEQLDVNYSGSVISQLSVKNLKQIKVPILDKEKQDKIGDTLKNQIERIYKARIKIDILLEERDDDINEVFQEVN